MGCSLEILDKNGKKIFEVPDLYKGNDVLDSQESLFLRCTVHTGEPMQWEEEYLVIAKFRDKYGRGTIRNEVSIRMIDIP